jgi:circadian clock protein KaiC
MFTSLTSGDSAPELSEVGVSSQMDAWLLLRNLECNGERNRGLYVLKARGIAHSNQIREFMLTDHGVQLRDVYVGPSGLLTGSARDAQEAKERAEALERKQQAQRKAFELTQKRQQLEAQIAKMRSDFELEEQGSLRNAHELELQEKQIVLDRIEMGRVRKADLVSAHGNGRA